MFQYKRHTGRFEAPPRLLGYIISKMAWVYSVLIMILLQTVHISACPNDPKDGPLTVGTYAYNVQLDLNNAYNLEWDVNSTHILFHVHVKTTGWVGFGLSPNGEMFPSDVIVAWVDDKGTPYFGDYHTIGRQQPVRDASQDWDLLEAKQVGAYTNVTMLRKLNTCDTEDEPQIGNGTTRVIWSFGTADPKTNLFSNLRRHAERGTKSLLLLDPPANEKGYWKAPKDAFSIDMLMNNYTVPKDRTTYACTMLELPKNISFKHHLIRWEPIIQKGHENLVHHTLIYFCKGNISDDLIGSTHSCYWQQPPGVGGCDLDIFVVWAIGGTAFNYPEEIGHSIGDTTDKRYFKIETHYDNPNQRSGYVDNSGFRLWLTPTPRKYDAGILEIGVRIDTKQVIPPRGIFMNRGICPPGCLTEYLKKPIKVVGGLLHSHLAGRSIVARHFRNNTELPPIMEDKHYDFDYQENRLLHKEIEIRPGDMLVTDCMFDTKTRTDVTYGGLDTTKEMCLGFLLYYPWNPLSACLSSVQYADSLAFDNKTLYDWTDQTVRDAFKTDMLKQDIENWCYGIDVARKFNGTITPTPDVDNMNTYSPQVCPSSG